LPEKLRVTSPYMKSIPSTEDFLLAAKQSEINALNQLATNCRLVVSVSDFIHELQKERGLSNSYLVSQGKRLQKERIEEIEAIDRAQQQFIATLKPLDLKRCGSSTIRLYHSLAYVLHSLDELPQVRESVSNQAISATDNTKFFNHLIAGLLAVIFEAADVSNDPDITKALIALFNFVQGKEYAGQERAWGVIGFTKGSFSNSTKDQIKALMDAQFGCFDAFNDFSSVIPAAQWRQLESAEAAFEMERMRQLIARFKTGDSLPTAIGEVWYQAATSRIDGMQEIVKTLTEELSNVCQTKVKQASDELKNHQAHLVSLGNYEAPPMSALTAMDKQSSDTTITMSNGVNLKLAQSIYDLVQKQAEHLRKVSEELTFAKQTLNERKLIEKAKGILMSSQGVSEEAAYKQLRQAAMDGNKRIIDIADNIISVSSMLNSQHA